MSTPNEQREAAHEEYVQTCETSHEWTLQALQHGRDPEYTIQRHREVVRNAWAAYVRAVPDWARW